MVRAQVIALSLGAGVAVAAGVLAWQGLLPGLQNSKPHMVREVSGPKRAVAPKATSAGPTQALPAAAPAAKRAEAIAAPPQGPTPPATPNVPQPLPVIPQFDTVRVEPSGDTVVAGRAAPGAEIDLLAGEQVIGTVKADEAGDFVIVPQPLAPGTYVLALRSRSAAATPVQSRQTITVSVPAKGQKGVFVALTEPGKASVLLSDPTAKAKSAAVEETAPPKPEPQKPVAAAPAVAFKTAEASNGAFYTTGIAPPRTHLRIYLNGGRLADVTTDRDGRWSVTVKKGMVPGHYTVRADALDAAGKVTARAEVPFDMPATVAKAKHELAPQAEAAPAEEAAKPAPPPQQTAAAASVAPLRAKTARTPASLRAMPANAIVPEIGTATVERGDSLWRISRKVFGHGIRYTLIYAANASQIRDPNLIYPGQVFVLPHAAD